MRQGLVFVVGARRPTIATAQCTGDIAVVGIAAIVRVACLLPKGAACVEALAARAAVAVILVLRVFGVGEVVEGVKNVGENLDMDVARPEEVEVFVMRDLGGNGLGWKFTEHGFNVDERVTAAVDEDYRGFDVAGRVLGHFGEAG